MCMCKYIFACPLPAKPLHIRLNKNPSTKMFKCLNVCVCVLTSRSPRRRRRGKSMSKPLPLINDFLC